MFDELAPGPVPENRELRWVANLRDFLRRGTGGTVGPSLEIVRGVTDIELHAYLMLLSPPGKRVASAIKRAAHTYARAVTKKYELQRVEVYPHLATIHLLIYKKKEKVK